jgi:hypothetical protein
MTKTHYFEFDFIYKGKTIPATCHVYYHEKSGSEMFYKYPMYRVAVNYHKIDPDVYVFMKLTMTKKDFFGIAYRT